MSTSHPNIQIARNRESGVDDRVGGLVVAFNFEGANVPSSIHLLPAGRIDGRDGRHWYNNAPEQIVQAFAENNGPLVIDYEHASDAAMWTGQPAPAAGWINKIENRDGEIWADVTWTEKATAMIAAQEYRFISPVFYYHADTLAILAMVSAGLTNQPNLVLTALNNRRDGKPPETKDHSVMNSEQYKALCRRLGLKEDASVESVMAALDTQSDELQTAQNSAANPPLDRFVPRADHDAMKLRAENAEQRLQDEDAKAINSRAEAAVDAAIKGGRIAPASKDYHLANCKTEDGLKAFNSYVEGQPVNPAFQVSGLNDKEAGGAAGQLTEAERAMCKRMGQSEEDFIATRDGKALPAAGNQS